MTQPPKTWHFTINPKALQVDDSEALNQSLEKLAEQNILIKEQKISKVKIFVTFLKEFFLIIFFCVATGCMAYQIFCLNKMAILLHNKEEVMEIPLSVIIILWFVIAITKKPDELIIKVVNAISDLKNSN